MAFNKFIPAVLLGAIAPTLSAIVLLYTDFASKLIPGKPQVLMMSAFFVNLIITRFQFKKGHTDTGKGLMLATFISMLLYFYFFKNTLL